mgnify:CR=1 FL=1
MPVTMKEIAKIAGVSQPAVSAALSSKDNESVRRNAPEDSPDRRGTQLHAE